jgi:hypothetical protein
MRPTTIWIAGALLVLGVCGILDAAGVVDSAQTIGQWWPVAIVGWAVAEMAGERRGTLGGVICSAIGVTLLADTQAWSSDAVLWSALAIVLGAAILTAGLRSGRRHTGAASGDAAGGGAS